MNRSPLFKSLIERLPSSLPEQRAVFLRFFCLLSGLNSAFYAITADLPIAFWSNIAAILSFAALFWASVRGLPYRSCAHLLVTVGFAHILLNTYISGGANSPGLAWFTIISVPVLFMLGRRAAILWLFAIFAAGAGLVKLTIDGLIPGNFLFSPENAFWGMSMHVNVMLSLMTIPFIYEMLHQKRLTELQGRSEELESARDALLQSQSHKDEFIAAVSHELRTPMNAILGFNDILRDEVAGDPKAQATITHIRQSADRLLSVINDILDFSQLQAGKLRVVSRPMPLQEILQQTFEHARAQEPEKTVEWRCALSEDLPNWVLGDPLRISQVLAHLLGNAAKFTTTGTVTLSAEPQADGVFFSVEDTGIGIPADRLSMIFGRFEYGDREVNRRYGGTGLGLSICERLVTLHAGKIGVESIPGQGSRFWFWLPLPPCAELSQATRDWEAARLALPAPRILIVDDNQVNRVLIIQTLRRLWPGAQLSEAGNGREALDILSDQSFDLVLMDMFMPLIDGVAATRILRRDYPAPARHTPVIGLTASLSHADREACLAGGMDAVVAKPFDPQQLVTTIGALLQVRERSKMAAREAA